MILPRRATEILAALALASPLLAGCGGQEQAEPTSYLITDLEGGTAAPDTVEIPESTSTPAPTPTTTPTKSPKPDDGKEDAPTGEDLVALVAAAAGELDSVRITIGNESGPPDIEADVVYGAASDFDATLQIAPDQPAVLLRRVDDSFFAGTSAGLKLVDPDDPRLASAAGGIVPAFLVWDPLLDLRAALEGAKRVSEGGPDDLDGASVSSYSFTLDLEGLPRPSLMVPDEVGGKAQVTLSLDEEDLPVRLQLEFDVTGVAATVMVGYSGWGAPVAIEVPEAPQQG